MTDMTGSETDPCSQVFDRYEQVRARGRESEIERERRRAKEEERHLSSQASNLSCSFTICKKG